MDSTPLFTSPLATELTLNVAGGKALSLSKLLLADYPVPGGFVVRTEAYLASVAELQLESDINRLASMQASKELNDACGNIRDRITSLAIPDDVAKSIEDSYHAIANDAAVAVRSSATAEDLPDASFAGQQDSFLNVRGLESVIEAIKACWASLWNWRAVSYRSEMGIPHGAVAMAVVVQEMVAADVSGIAFTANPFTGERGELVVTASYGLGESIVGGQVNPDTMVVDRETFEVKESSIGAKASKIVSLEATADCTKLEFTKEVEVDEEAASNMSLNAELLEELTRIGVAVEKFFDGTPQDIEFAVSKEAIWLVQSRPITNLPDPLSDFKWEVRKKGDKFIRRQIVENMPEPLCPLFDDLYLTKGLEASIDHFVERFKIPVNFDDIIERPMFLTVNGFAYCRANYRFRWKLLWAYPRVMIWYAFNLRSLLKNSVKHWQGGLAEYRNVIDSWRQKKPDAYTDTELLESVRQIARADAIYWFYVAVVLGIAKVTDGMLHWFVSSRFVRGDHTSGEFLRGFPSRTASAQAELETIASKIRSRHEVRDAVQNSVAENLLDTIANMSGNEDIQADIDSYLNEYGHQFYNLDFIQPTQREQPNSVMLSLKAMIAKPDYEFEKRQIEICEERDRIVKEVLASLGPFRRWIFRKFLKWAQNSGPYREDAMFYVGLGWPELRCLALELGNRLVRARTVDTAEDIFFLNEAELVAAIEGRDAERPACYQEQVAARRKLRENRLRLHPPPMVPEGSRFKFGPFDMSALETQKRNADDANELDGFAVSPGSVTGVATVIMSPDDFSRMQPDSILVCPTTTPAWTPLFTQAIGLVTDIGGILAHGSIVAREYGIPAVLGTGTATKRIKTGQLIRIDGNAGTVTIMEDED